MIKLFRGKKNLTASERLRSGSYESVKERDQLLAEAETEAGEVGAFFWMLTDRDPSIRSSAQRLCRTRPPREVLSHLLLSWEEFSPAARRSISRALPDLLGRGWEKDFVALLESGDKEKAAICEQILSSLPEGPSSKSIRLQRMGDASAEDRAEVVREMASSDKAETVTAQLEAFLDDDDEKVVLEVISGLGSSGEAEAVDVLCDRFARPCSKSVEVAIGQALIGLAMAGNEVIGILGAHLKGTPNEGVRRAIQLLLQLPGGGAEQSILEYLASIHAEDVRALVANIDTLQGRLMGPLRQMLLHNESSVRATALG
ncbi:MAG: HEAT repeat domain-containing protein, partial [Myxococcales bacterium]|nr:HEAT repeat domain-containing protein [Myxococcales bacterium]